MTELEQQYVDHIKEIANSVVYIAWIAYGRITKEFAYQHGSARFVDIPEERKQELLRQHEL